MAILYTQAQVDNAKLRAQVAMYDISRSIENGFYYLGSSVYQTYKDLQYDIYILLDIISNEEPFVTFNPSPTTYETSFYELVGSMINKTKQFDVYGVFGGSTNPNYQPPTNTIVVPGGTSGQVIEFTINAGEPIPFEYAYTLSEQPDVSFYISNGSGGLTTNGANNITNNLIDGVMYIYGNPNDDGEFNEDTYVRIEV